MPSHYNSNHEKQSGDCLILIRVDHDNKFEVKDPLKQSLPLVSIGHHGLKDTFRSLACLTRNFGLSEIKLCVANVHDGVSLFLNLKLEINVVCRLQSYCQVGSRCSKYSMCHGITFQERCQISSPSPSCLPGQ